MLGEDGLTGATGPQPQPADQPPHFPSLQEFRSSFAWSVTSAVEMVSSSFQFAAGSAGIGTDGTEENCNAAFKGD